VNRQLGQVATRVVYGLRGAKLIPSLLRALVSIYWFSFQTLVGASAIVAVLAKMTGITYSLVWISVIFGFIQACVAVIGFGSLKVLARVALPIKVIVLAYLFVLFARHDDPNFECQSTVLPGRQRLDLGFAGGLAERRDCRLADQHHRCGGFRPLHALADRDVGWHLRRRRARSVAVHRARRVRGRRNPGVLQRMQLSLTT
jgi:Permease for cytosine/purines, uracil, thiamine, allantoin